MSRIIEWTECDYTIRVTEWAEVSTYIDGIEFLRDRCEACVRAQYDFDKPTVVRSRFGGNGKIGSYADRLQAIGT
jgi:hypothetical protein